MFKRRGTINHSHLQDYLNLRNNHFKHLSTQQSALLVHEHFDWLKGLKKNVKNNKKKLKKT